MICSNTAGDLYSRISISKSRVSRLHDMYRLHDLYNVLDVGHLVEHQFVPVRRVEEGREGRGIVWSERAVREEALGVMRVRLLQSEAVARVCVPWAGTAGGSHHPSDSTNDHNIECEDTLSSKGACRLAAD